MKTVYALKTAAGVTVATSEFPIVELARWWSTRGRTWLDPAPGDGSYVEEVRDLAAERSLLWEQVKAERDARAQAGGYLAAGKWFHSDTFSRTQQIGLTMMGASIPAGLMWKTMDGSFIEMTQALAGQVFAAAAASDAALFAYAESLRALINAAEDPQTINIRSGWPPMYGG